MLFILILIPVVLASCSGHTSKTISEEKVINDTTYPATDSTTQMIASLNDADTIPRSIKLLDTDYYPVTDSMFKKYATVVKDGYTSTDEYVWFSNKATKQTLVFELYTDFHHLWTYNFLNSEVSTWALNRMEVNIPEKEPTDYINNLISSAHEIGKKYFVTNTGLKLGDSKEKIIGQYGKPDKIFRNGGVDIYQWGFMGDNIYLFRKSQNKQMNLKRKPLARSSFGYDVFIFIHNNKIVGILLHNSIP